MDWLPIQYRDFYDVPRLIAVERTGEIYLFDCPFDDETDEYSDWFVIYRLPPENRGLLDEASWRSLTSLGEPVGRLAVKDIELDPSRRRAINDAVFRKMQPLT
jgi:hypothetical protein